MRHLPITTPAKELGGNFNNKGQIILSPQPSDDITVSQNEIDDLKHEIRSLKKVESELYRQISGLQNMVRAFLNAYTSTPVIPNYNFSAWHSEQISYFCSSLSDMVDLASSMAPFSVHQDRLEGYPAAQQQWQRQTDPTAFLDQVLYQDMGLLYHE